MEPRTVATGALSLIVGMLLGYVISPSGRSVADLEDTLSARFDQATQTAGEGVSDLRETVASLDEKLAALTDQVGVLDGRIGETAGAGVAAASDGFAALEARLTETAEELRTALTETAADQKAALEDALAGLTAAQDSAPEPEQAEPRDTIVAPEAPATAATPAAQAPEASPAPSPASAPIAGALSPGRTAILADDAVRVFISRVDEAASAARLSINGAMASLTAGRSVAVRPDGDYCRVTLDAVGGGQAKVSALCGDDVPAPEGTTPGSVAVFGDGAARVFVSQVSSDESAVRIAVNGLDVQSVEAGRAVPVGEDGCSLSVDQIDRGHVIFGYHCDS